MSHEYPTDVDEDPLTCQMRIDRVNDVWGDAELIANELKTSWPKGGKGRGREKGVGFACAHSASRALQLLSASNVDLHIRRADDFPSTPTP